MATDLKTESFDVGAGEINKYDFRNEENYIFKSRKGLDEQIVRQISDMKGEPDWMRDFRLKSLEIFSSKTMNGESSSQQQYDDPTSRTDNFAMSNRRSVRRLTESESIPTTVLSVNSETSHTLNFRA